MSNGHLHAGLIKDGLHGAWPAAAPMMAPAQRSGEAVACPHPHATAPIIQGGITQLLPPPARLVGVVRGLIYRDMRGLKDLQPAQMLTQYCVTPAASLSWYSHGTGGFVQEHPRDASRGLWQPMASSVMVSGVPTAPSSTWMPEPGAGYMVVLWPDAFHRVFGLAPDELSGQTDDAFKRLPAAWHAMLEALYEADGPDRVLAVLEQHLSRAHHPAREQPGGMVAGRQMDLHGDRPGDPPTEWHPDWRAMARQGRAWLEQVSLRAVNWRRAAEGGAATQLSERQIERRIKAFTGQSMRQWKSLIRDEAAFHLAAAKASQAQGLNLSDLAFEAGYADQAHMSRVVKRLTGFSPAEFTQRYRTDEGFWLYRLWGG